MLLSPRALHVLQAVVEYYITSAHPVSSKHVAESLKALKLSSASIRAIMADLEQAGLLMQPHTSAGRIPSEEGFRLYLQSLMHPKLHPWDRTRLAAATQHEAELAHLPSTLVRSLAGLSGQ